VTGQTEAPVLTGPWPTWPQHDGRDLASVAAVVASGDWNGVDAAETRAFEREWTAFLGVGHTVTCSNGTVSLQIALRALGVGSGDEVIVPPYTFAATATAVLEVSALPVFADIEPDSYCIDPAAVEAAITERTKAVIAVHLGGHPADVDRLSELCRKHGLALIEDAAHAHGSEWRGRKVGAFGAFGSWSFQGSKNLTSGEGGALTTDDADLAELADSYRNCGRSAQGAWYAHYRLGENHRLTAVQAALLRTGLLRLPDQIHDREACAAALDEQLSAIDGIRPLPRDPRATTHAYHLYQFRYDAAAFGGRSRDEFIAELVAAGVPASSGYPQPLYRQPIFAEQAFDTRATGWSQHNPATRYNELHLPVCEQTCAETVWLPHSMLLAPSERMDSVADTVARIQKSGRR
jgi:dTDP-4-amino-4,6-dideoxygalactose transaminase